MPLEEIGTLTIGGLRQLASEAMGSSGGPNGAELKPECAPEASKRPPSTEESSGSGPATPTKTAEATPTPGTPDKVKPNKRLALQLCVTPSSKASASGWLQSYTFVQLL